MKLLGDWLHSYFTRGVLDSAQLLLWLATMLAATLAYTALFLSWSIHKFLVVVPYLAGISYLLAILLTGLSLRKYRKMKRSRPRQILSLRLAGEQNAEAIYDKGLARAAVTTGTLLFSAGCIFIGMHFLLAPGFNFISPINQFLIGLYASLALASATWMHKNCQKLHEKYGVKSCFTTPRYLTEARREAKNNSSN